MNEVKSPKKPLLFYYLIALLLVFLFNSLALPYIARMQIKTVDYGEFMAMTYADEIGSVDI